MDYKQLIESLNNIEAVAFGYSVNGKVCGMDCSDFEQIIVDAVDAITDLLTHIETDEARAEKGKDGEEREVKTIFKWTGCPECKHWDSKDEWCKKYDRYANSFGRAAHQNGVD